MMFNYKLQFESCHRYRYNDLLRLADIGLKTCVKGQHTVPIPVGS